jgi:hypothetical protein
MLKKVFIIILIVAALLMVLSLFAPKKKTVRFDSIEQHAQSTSLQAGKVASDQRKLAVFNQIEAEDNVRLHMNVGAPEASVRIQAAKRLLPFVKLVVANKQLKISISDHPAWHIDTPVQIFIDVPQLEVIKLEDVVQANVRHLSSKSLLVMIEDAAKLKLQGSAQQVNARVEDTSSLLASHLKTQTSSIVIEDSGRANIQVHKALIVSATDSAQLNVTGRVQSAQITANDSAHINAPLLDAQRVDATAGDAAKVVLGKVQHLTAVRRDGAVITASNHKDTNE